MLDWELDRDGVRLNLGHAPDDAARRWAENAGGLPSADGTSIWVPLSAWPEAGRLPSDERDPEILDAWAAHHEQFGRLLQLDAQNVLIESIGYLGAAGLRFGVTVDGHLLADDSDGPFAQDVAGHRHALLPVAFAVVGRVAQWNRTPKPHRNEQIAFFAELRAYADRAARCLETTSSPVTFQYDQHLADQNISTPETFGLSWSSHGGAGKFFDLDVSYLDAEGRRVPLDVGRLDPAAPVVSLSGKEHILLSPDVDTVVRAAKLQRGRSRKVVERHLSSPRELLPEGVSLDQFDLAAYGDRVLGFAPIKAERGIDIRASGTAWYRRDDDPTLPFLRLEIARPGGSPAVLDFDDAAEAERFRELVASELRTATPAAVDHRGHRVQPTAELESSLKRNIPLAAATRAHVPTSEGTMGCDATDAATGIGPPNKVTRLAAVIKEQDIPTTTDDPVEADDVPFALLDTLLAPDVELKPHQRQGIAWLWRQLRSGRAGALLADDMGLGKTLQLACVLALFDATRLGTDDGRPNLVVCPVILLENWHSELGKFFKPHAFESTLILHDDGLRRVMTAARTLDVSQVCRHRLVLTNYKTLERFQLALLRIDWGIVVLDEAQAIKNPDTATALAARGLKRAFGVCSTGTPVENRLLDLWALYDFMSPGDPFTSRPEFSRTYEDAADGVPRVRETLGYPARGVHAPLLRRLKTVLALPAKHVEVRKIPMLPSQVETERLIARRQGAQVLQVLQDLQKLYQHPRLLEQGGDLDVDMAVNESPKLAACLDIIRSIRERGEKVLVFTLWTRMQDLLAVVIKAVLDMPSVPIVNGMTNQGGRSGRLLEAFQGAPGFGVMILSPLAAGAGLNIVGANHVIHYGRWWNAAKEDQATDRVYRIGQTRPVSVYYPVMHHPNDETLGFDTKLHELVEKKRGMARDFLAPRGEGDPTWRDLQPSPTGQI